MSNASAVPKTHSKRCCSRRVRSSWKGGEHPEGAGRPPPHPPPTGRPGTGGFICLGPGEQWLRPRKDSLAATRIPSSTTGKVRPLPLTTGDERRIPIAKRRGRRRHRRQLGPGRIQVQIFSFHITEDGIETLSRSRPTAHHAQKHGPRPTQITSCPNIPHPPKVTNAKVVGRRSIAPRHGGATFPLMPRRR